MRKPASKERERALQTSAKKRRLLWQQSREKEAQLRAANGPHSMGEAKYEKVLFAKPNKEE